MKILIAGASGVIGSELKLHVLKRGVQVATLGRSKNNSPDSFSWDPTKGTIEKECFKDIDVIINLAGDGIASGFWNQAKKDSIRNSRILSTRLIVETLKSTPNKVSCLINASATGYYQSSDTLKDETGSAGNSFLSAVCIDWESEAKKAEELGIRVAIPRIGIVLTKSGAALQRMLLPFKLCLGGNLGDGNQYWSWISLRDVVDSLLFIAENNNLSGPVNLCSPNPVTNQEFTLALGKALSRPTIFNVPSFVLKLILGEMAEELLLASMRIEPKKLLNAGYEFKDNDISAFLENEL